MKPCVVCVAYVCVIEGLLGELQLCNFFLGEAVLGQQLQVACKQASLRNNRHDAHL